MPHATSHAAMPSSASPPGAPKLIHAASLVNFPEVARTVGLDPLALLQKFDIPLDYLQRPQLKLPIRSVCQLLEEAAKSADQPAFGLMLSEQRRLSNFGLPALLVMNSATVRHALTVLFAQAQRFNPTLVVTLHEFEDSVVIAEEFLFEGAAHMHQGMELSIGVLVRCLRQLLGADWQARRVCFRHPGPKDLGIHRRLLGQTPEFLCDFDGIVLRKADLDTPVATADPALANHVRQHLENLEQDGAATPVTHAVQELVLGLLPSGRCTIETVSKHLGITRRTLHRQLLAEGESFTHLLHLIRHEHAVHHVDHGRQPLTEVARLLGFARLSGFSRWYRQTFGETAEARRRQRTDCRVSPIGEPSVIQNQ